jgi:hypothetical protein
MTRRMIDAGIWANEHFAMLPPMARLLQIGIINMADDQGRMKAHPAYLRSQIFPYDDVLINDVQSWLDQIAANDTLILYEVDGKAYLQLLNWWQYQSPSFASPSQYPRPDGWNDRIRYTGKSRIIYTCNWLTSSGELSPDTCDQDGTPLPNGGESHAQPHGEPGAQPHGEPGAQPHGEPGTPLIENKYKYKNKGENTPPLFDATSGAVPRVSVAAAEYTKRAKALGLDARQFRQNVDALLEIVGKRALVDANPDDRDTTFILNDAKEAVLSLAQLGYGAPDVLTELADSWMATNQWRHAPPTFRQLKEHASAVASGVQPKAQQATNGWAGLSSDIPEYMRD